MTTQPHIHPTPAPNPPHAEPVHVDGDAYIWPPLVTCSACRKSCANETAHDGTRWGYGLICPTCHGGLVHLSRIECILSGCHQ